METVADDFLERLRAYVRKRVRSVSDADDVVQTVVLRLLEAQATREIESAHAWVLSTARTVIADLHRARARAAERLEQEVAAAAPDDEADITYCLGALLRSLDPEDRTVLKRVDVDHESQVALAAEHALTTTAMKSRVQRARARLRAAVLARCKIEVDAQGRPTGAATCKPPTGGESCGCG
ncbi:MAG: sigma-70 family RNA polymerase sigma factor [Planctomycetes bacterium]|nr:sigma-70 family RNA polymerase sigma factor [Planctomycetota bacterium]